MVPGSLQRFTSPIVEKALETGARGRTVTKTDYGVIGDAMFKKAQLDMNIASLQSDFGVRSAEILGNLEMQKADIALKGSELKMNAEMKAYEIKEAERANKASGTEQLLGSLSGAMSGAATGATLSGGNPYAIAGGAALGGLSTYQGYQQDGRRGGVAAQTMLSNISTASATFKGAMDMKKSRDAWGSHVKTGQQLFDAWQNAQPGVDPATGMSNQEEAKRMFDNHVNSTGATVGQYMNPEQAADLSAKYAQSYDRGMNSSKPEVAAAARMQKRIVDFSADSVAQNPNHPEYRKRVTKFLGEMDTDHSIMTNKPMTSTQAKSFLNAAGVSTPARSTAAAPVISQPTTTAPARQRGAAPSSGTESIGKIKTPSNGRSVEQSPTTLRATEAAPDYLLRRNVSAAPGVTMDQMTGMNMMTQSHLTEVGLQKQGAETLSVLDKMNKPYEKGEVAESFKKPIRDFGADVKDTVADIAGAPKRLLDRMKAGPYKEQPRVSSRQKEEEVKANYVQRDFNGEMAKKMGPEKWAEAEPFFTKTDPREVQEHFNTMDKEQSPADKGRIEGITAATAQLNELKADLPEAMKGVERPTLKAFLFYRKGYIGVDGMAGSSKGGMVKGIGLTFSDFEKSVRQSYEGKGEAGKELADLQIQKLADIEARLAPIAQSLAVSKQGSRPSDKDVEGYDPAELLDPNPDNSIARMNALQKMMYSDFLSLMGNTPSRAEAAKWKKEVSPKETMGEKLYLHEAKKEIDAAYKKDSNNEEDDYLFELGLE